MGNTRAVLYRPISGVERDKAKFHRLGKKLGLFSDRPKSQEYPKVKICVPVKDQIDYGTQGLLNQILARGVSGYSAVLYSLASSEVVAARNDSAEDASDFEAIFFIDGDMIFQPDDIKKLLDYNYPVVAGVCTTRGKQGYLCPYLPVMPAMMRLNKWGQYEVVIEGFDYVNASEEERKSMNPLIEVDAVGTAFMCIRKEVWEKMDKPFFELWPRPDQPHKQMGEDVSFCKKVRALGFPIYVDTSVIVGHTGEYVYSIYDFLEHYQKDMLAEREVEHDLKEKEWGDKTGQEFYESQVFSEQKRSEIREYLTGTVKPKSEIARIRIDNMIAQLAHMTAQECGIAMPIIDSLERKKQYMRGTADDRVQS